MKIHNLDRTPQSELQDVKGHLSPMSDDPNAFSAKYYDQRKQEVRMT
jgi:hypothetical protein